MKFCFGIDLGGTSAKLALLNSQKKIIKESSVITSGSTHPQDLVSRLSSEAKKLIGHIRIKKVGVGVAGDIDFDRGAVRVSPNLKWRNVPLKKLLSQNLRCPVIVDNDANVAAWGIYQTLVPKQINTIVVLTLGTGVGGGLILNGEIYRGMTGSAGEVGHMIMVPDGRRCNCGNSGCLEAYVGGIYITKLVRTALSKGQQSRLQSLYAENPEDIDPKEIAEAARAGDAYAKSIWEEVGSMLGLALGNLIYVFNPPMIFLTGGISHARDLILSSINKKLAERTFRVPIGAAKIQIPHDATHFGVIGAALL